MEHSKQSRLRSTFTVELTGYRISGESTVFLVDDDPSIVFTLSRLIRGGGYNVESYPSVEEFLRAHDLAVPGCAILDVAMGRWNGPDVARQLSNQDLIRQVIFMTGFLDLHTSVQAMKLGAVDFLTKPVSDVELFCAIRLALKKSDQRVH